MPERADEQRIEPTFGENPPATEAGAAAPNVEASVEALQKELEAARAQIAEQQDKFLRAKAETENIRRRAEADIASARRYAVEGFAAELLAVRDSLELAQAVDLSQGQGVVEKVVEGLDLTLKLMEAAFQKYSLTVLNPEGEKFDPEKHQAMTMIESDTVPPNHVAKVVQKGYLIHNRLLRPAMVVVAKAKTAN